jgi:hypothetical protein
VLTASGSRWWSRPGSRGGGEYGVRLAVEELRRGSRGGGLGLGLAVEGNTALGSRWRSCGVGLVVVVSAWVSRWRGIRR